MNREGRCGSETRGGVLFELTEEELREVETEYKKTGEPVILKEVFDESDKKKD